MKRTQLHLCVTVIAIFAGLGVAACGTSVRHPTTVAPSTERGVRATAANDQSGIADNECLKKDGVKATRRPPGQRRKQHGDTGLIRYGEPLTKEEAQAAMRRCVKK
jgi:hypothetical protein